MKQLYYEIPSLYAETEEKAVYRARSDNFEIVAESLTVSEEDYQLLSDILKSAADDIYIKIRSLMRDPKGKPSFHFEPDDFIAYSIFPYKNFDVNILTSLYTAIKDYFVESMLLGFYRERGYEKGILLSTAKQEELLSKIQQYRLSTTKSIRRKGQLL